MRVALLILLAVAAPAHAAYLNFEQATPPSELQLAGVPWEIDATAAASGTRSLRAGTLPPFEEGTASWNVTLAVPATLSFAWRFDGPPSVDFELWIDGARVQSFASNTTTWTQYRRGLAVGAHTVQWRAYRPLLGGNPVDIRIDDVSLMTLSGDVSATLSWGAEEVPIGSAVGVAGLGVQDFDSDGRADLLVPSSSSIGYWQFLRWTGSAFTRPYTGPQWGTDPVHVEAFAGANGPRVAVATSERIYIVDPTQPASWSSFAIERNLRDMRIADVDGDGGLDAIVVVDSTQFGGFAVVAYRLSDGSQLWRRSLTSTATPTALLVADLSTAPGLEVAVLQFGLTVLTGSTGAPIPVAAFNGTFAAAADVDADGTLELLLAGGRTLSAVDVDAGNTLWSWTSPGIFFINAIAARDLDGDARAEIAVGHERDGTLELLRGSDRQSLCGRTVGINSTVTQLRLDDLGSDGSIEIIGTSSGDVSFSGIPQALFALRTSDCTVISSLPGQPHGLFSQARLADVDGDGTIELVSLEFRNSVVRDPWTLANRWSIPGNYPVDLAQVDGDPALEVLGHSPNDFRDIVLYDGALGTIQQTLRLDNPTVLMALLPPGEFALGIGSGIEIRDLPTGSSQWWSGGGSTMTPVWLETAQLDMDASLEVVAADTGTLNVFDVATRAVSWQVATGTDTINAVAVDRPGRVVAVGRRSGIYLYDAMTGAPLRRLPLASDATSLWTAMLDGRRIVVAAETNQTFEIFDATNDARIGTMPIRLASVGADHNNQVLVTGPGRMSIWTATETGVHRLDAVVGIPPLFSNGFE